MDLILTGRMMDAAEAERSGLVARVVPAASLMDEAMKVAETIAGMSLPSVLAAKEAVNRAFESSLAEGVRFERRIFHALFATEDQKEGMKAFVEKRKAQWKNKWAAHHLCLSCPPCAFTPSSRLSRVYWVARLRTGIDGSLRIRRESDYFLTQITRTTDAFASVVGACAAGRHARRGNRAWSRRG